MPTDTIAPSILTSAPSIASRRILRLALGVSLSMLFSQVGNWPLSFLAPVFTLVLLGLPFSAPSFKGGLNFIVTLMVALFASRELLPFLEHAPMAGLLLLVLCLFWSFYYTAMGGSALIGSFITIGLTMLIAIGSVNIDAYVGITNWVVIGASVGLAFVWVAHALLSDPPSKPSSSAHHSASVKPDRQAAVRKAFRSLMIVLPVALLFLFWSASTSFIVVIIKVASLGQQASVDNTHSAGRKMIESTAWGGVGAIVAWTILQACPTLVMYTLLIALAGLLFASGIFKGEGMHSKGGMWSYAFLTMIIILAPTVGGGASGKSAAEGFWFRQVYFLVLALYSSFAVVVFDAFWSAKKKGSLK